MFLSALGGAKDQHRSAVTGAFSAVDDAMAAAGLKNFGTVPFGKLTMGLRRVREIIAYVKTIYWSSFNQLMILLVETAGLGQSVKKQIFYKKSSRVFRGFVDQQGGSLTLNASTFKKTLNKNYELTKMTGTGKEVGVLTR